MGPKRSGKKWHHQAKRPRDDRDGGDGGDGGGNESGEQRPKKLRRAAVMNLGNVKGHQAVIATCDIRNDRQATAELVDLLNAVADDMYPADAEGDGPGHEGGGAAAASSPPVTAATGTEGQAGNGAEVADESATAALTAGAAAAASAAAPTPPEKSVEDMIREEADELRSGAAKIHRFKSVNTTVKGVVMVCVTDPKVDVLRLVDALYAEIRTTKVRRSRFLERVTPLQVTAYPELEAFREAAEPIVSAGLPPVADGVPPLAVEVRPAAGGGKKAEAGAAAAASKEGPAATTEAAAAVGTAPDGGLSLEKSDTGGGPSGAGGKAEAEGGKQQATATAAGAAGGVSGSAEAGGATQEGGAASAGGSGGKKRTSDKRWKFRVDIRRRNSALKRPDLINAVVGSVGEGHSVSMSSPEVGDFAKFD